MTQRPLFATLLPRMLLLLAALLAPLAAWSVQEVDRIVAVVNDDVVLKSELVRKMQVVRAQLERRQTALPPAPVLARQVLERMVLERIQMQEAKRTGVTVDDDMLNDALRRIAEQNRLTLPQFKSVLEREGFDFPAFREDIRTELTLAQLRRKQVEARIVVTDREVDNFLGTVLKQANADDEYHLAQIMVALPEAPSPEVIQEREAKAREILEALRGGADFAQTAVAKSDGQEALSGGDLGWRKGSQIPSLFAPVVQTMSPGQVSDLIRSPAGFHIVKLVDVRGGDRLVISQTKARHILIKTGPGTSDEQARTRLQQLRERIRGGDDFAELARSHSMDAGSAARGGDLGWVSPGDLVPDFEAVMDDLPVGAVSEPFRTPFGWHIAQVQDRRRHDSTDEVRRSKAREAVRKRKLDEETETWLRRLRDEAYVEYRIEE